VLDLNPDQAVAAGWLRGRSVAARLLDHMLLWSFRRASRIVVLDRHMSRRVRSKGVPEEKIVVIPPWAQDESVSYDPAGRQEFREAHGLSDKYVVMYAGNHSPCHPLDTLLEAAARLAAHPKVAFCFLGGGSEFEKVRHFAQRHGVGNILCLPYQPLERLSRSLSAADLHVVVMGQGFAGIVHTCKIYNVLALGIPFLYIGPAESHVTDLISTAAVNGNARVAAHGDADAVTRCILAGAGSRPASPSIEEMRVAEGFSQGVLTGRMVETLEAAGAPERARSAACSRSTAVAG
jgi:glycosyltransferase involved in cell wall biosynthesis